MFETLHAIISVEISTNDWLNFHRFRNFTFFEFGHLHSYEMISLITERKSLWGAILMSDYVCVCVCVWAGLCVEIGY